MKDQKGEEIDPDKLKRMSWQELNDTAWRNGHLRHLMHGDTPETYPRSQRALSDKLRAWQKVQPRNPTGRTDTFEPVFVLPISKRWGKSTECIWLKTEDGVQMARELERPMKFRYTAAFEHSINAIINDVQGLAFATAPPDMKPTYVGKRGPRGAGFYFPEYGPTLGLIIYLDGIETNPDSLRGQACDGDVVSECAFIPGLMYTVRNVLVQQYQQRDHAYMILESSAPDVLDTDWETYFLPDAVERDAIFDATIEDNPKLTRERKDYWIRLAGGRGSVDCEREYFNVIAVPTDDRLVPEFDPLKHVVELPMPAHAHGYVSADPGSADLFGIQWAWWDFERALLYIRKDWAKRNASTDEVAEVIRAGEQELWGMEAEAEPYVYRPVKGISRYEMLQMRGFDHRREEHANKLTYYDDNEQVLKPNPYMRVTDVDRRLAADLGRLHKLDFHPADKTDSAEARKNAFRGAVKQGRILVHPECKQTISHWHGGRWNKRRTDWARTTQHGHFDLLACGIQLWRIVEQNLHLNPMPPARPLGAAVHAVVDDLPWQQKAQREREAMDVMNGLLDDRRGGTLRVRMT